MKGSKASLQRFFLTVYLTRNLVEYFVGSEERFELSLEIQNGGEDAYEATLHLDLPESLSYIKTEVVEGYGEATVPVLCSPPTHNNNFVLKCDLGNPMAAGSKVTTKGRIGFMGAFRGQPGIFRGQLGMY